MDMTKKTFCSSECDFKKYYINQAGGGISDIQVYRGSRYQKGYGIFGSLLKRYGVPVLKFLGQQVFKSGSNVVSDIVRNNKDPKETIKGALKTEGRRILSEGAKRIATHFDNQEGRGLKRKRNLKKKKSKRFKKDIFG